MSGYIGAIPTPQATQSRDVYTATSNQTTFTTQGYTPNFVSVYLNGVHLARADFTATNGSDVVLASGATADDVVEIISFGTFQSADALPLTGGTMTGDLIVPDGDLILGSTAVTATAAEINLIDGGTARGTTAVADGDGFLTNDGGTMRMTKVDTLATYMGTKIGGGLEFIASTDASSSANVSFTGFDSSKYDSYVFTLGNVLPATDNVFLDVVFSVDGGSNYLTASDSYTATDSTGQGAGDAPRLRLYYTGQGNAALDAGISANVNLNFPHINAPTYLLTSGLHTKANGGLELSSNQYGPGKTKAATVVNAIKFSYSSGNIASGTITMYGMVNS